MKTSASESAGAPAWSRDELAADPHASEQKADKVRRMFGAIAGRYDLNNRLHSFGRDQAWRRAAVRAAGVTPDSRVLDVACGTGDLSRLMLKAGAAHVVGADFTLQMLDVARRKDATPVQEGRMEYVEADAMAMPFADASFDVVSISFGIRNVAEPAKALAEFFRVLKPGGRLVILEFSEPRFGPIRWLNNIYCRWLMPRTATLLSGDKSGAYFYLPKSISTFLDRESMVRAIEDAGFTGVTQKAMTFGVCVRYRAVKD